MEGSVEILERPKISQVTGEAPESPPEPKDDMENERSNRPSAEIAPFNKVIVNRIDETELVNGTLQYLARTRNLEIGTRRTQILQGIVDKMLHGEDFNARVVILNKGSEMNAFVLPDGTVCVFQSLLDGLDSMDEVGGILAHELGHLKYKTHENRQRSQEKFGTGWLHEAVSDSEAPKMLEKAGLNTFGFVNAIKKISANERGDIHQTGFSRASQNVGLHIGIDYATSSKDTTPLPQELKGRAKKTNIEIIAELIKQKDVEAIAQSLDLLHPADLSESFKLATKEGTYMGKFPREDHLVVQKYTQYFEEKLTAEGYSSEEIKLFILIVQNRFMRVKNFSIISSAQELPGLISNLGQYASEDKNNEMHKILFNRPDNTKPYFANILENLETDLYDETQERNEFGIPVTQQTILEIAKQAMNLDEKLVAKLLESKLERREKIEMLFAVYISKYRKHKKFNDMTFKNEDTGFMEEIDVVNLLNQLKELGFEPDLEKIKNKFPQISSYFETVFGEKEDSLDSKIEGFFRNLELAQNYGETKHVFENFLNNFRKQLDEQEIDAEKRREFLGKIKGKIDVIDIAGTGNLIKRLKLDLKSAFSANGQDINQLLARFNMSQLAGFAIFEQDSPEFYDYMTDLMKTSSIPTEAMTKEALINLSSNYFNATSYQSLDLFNGENSYSSEFLSLKNRVKISNYNSFLDLPYIKQIRENPEVVNCESLKELNDYINQRANKLIQYHSTEAFEDTVFSIMLNGEVRRNFSRILNQGIEIKDYGDLAAFLSRSFPNGPKRRLFIREAKKRFLESTEIGLDQKISYVINNFSDIGPDGVIKIAEQINTLDDYLKFRQKVEDKLRDYLSGSPEISLLAASDYLSSKLIGNHELLFETSKDDKESKGEVSTRITQNWLDFHFPEYTTQIVKYDKETGKVTGSGAYNQYFRTIYDDFDALHSLSEFQRFAIALKALVDKDGALTSDERRQQLSQIMLDSLNVDNSFLQQAISEGAKTAPAEFVSFPAAQMMAPLLFRALDVDEINFSELKAKGKNALPKNAVKKIVTSQTRDIIQFGAGFISDPTTEIAAKAIESDTTYFDVTDKLTAIFETTAPNGKSEKQPTSDSSEAIIGAVERSGALGVRSLQLSRQLHRFSEGIDRRLAQSFDNRPGLNKLLFWENLVKLSQRHPEIAQFLDQKLVSVDELLGGGSLYTTFAATIRLEDGQTARGVFKILNPNPGVFIESTYSAAQDVLDSIESTGTDQDKKYARMGKVFIDLSREWCLRDINDPNFEEDDDRFQSVVNSYNSRVGKSIMYMPRRFFNSYNLKSEERADGETLNQFLQDESVSPRKKREAVHIIQDFYIHQLESQNGSDEILVHSDPHVGNYMVDGSQDTLRIGVIDRSMYLKLNRKEAQIFARLLRGESYRKFVPKLLDAVLDRNKITSEITRKQIIGRIMTGLKSEYIGQTWRNIKSFKPRQGVDNFTLLRRLMTEVSEAKLDIPLEYRLMIRNVEAFRELSKNYS